MGSMPCSQFTPIAASLHILSNACTLVKPFDMDKIGVVPQQPGNGYAGKARLVLHDALQVGLHKLGHDHQITRLCAGSKARDDMRVMYFAIGNNSKITRYCKRKD